MTDVEIAEVVLRLTGESPLGEDESGFIGKIGKDRVVIRGILAQYNLEKRHGGSRGNECTITLVNVTLSAKETK